MNPTIWSCDLPDEIIQYVKYYIPDKWLIFTNRTNYIRDHSYIVNRISRNNYYSYIRNVLRNDHDFVFEKMLETQIYDWYTMVKYSYKNITYPTFYSFVIDYCVENRSTKILNIMRQSGLNIKSDKHKAKIRVKWKK